MISVAPFKASDLDEIRVHPAQRATLARDDTPAYRLQLEAGLSFTGRLNGEILMCGGVLDLYQDRRVGHLWSILSRSARPHFLIAHGAAARFIETTGKQWLIATCEIREGMSCRWLRTLGFEFDHTEDSFGPAATPHAVYVRHC